SAAATWRSSTATGSRRWHANATRWCARNSARSRAKCLVPVTHVAAAHAVRRSVDPHDLHARIPGQGAGAVAPGDARLAAPPGHDRQRMGAVGGLNDGHEVRAL